MKKIFAIWFPVLLLMALLSSGGCKTGAAASPQALLYRYFCSAERQDYGTAYECYYEAYKAKINRAEYIKRRKEDPSKLKEFKILSVAQSGGSARAQVLLAFEPSGKKKAKPVDITVTENMVKENGNWKIKVW